MGKLYAGNAKDFVGKKIDCKNRRLGYYPMTVMLQDGAYYIEDANGVCMPLPEKEDSPNSVYFDYVVEPDAKCYKIQMHVNGGGSHTTERFFYDEKMMRKQFFTFYRYGKLEHEPTAWECADGVNWNRISDWDAAENSLEQAIDCAELLMWHLEEVDWAACDKNTLFELSVITTELWGRLVSLNMTESK